MGNIFIEKYEEKRKIIESLERELSKEDKLEALKDEHTYRKPIGCGFTVHSGYGCDNRCLYCYIQDMGLSFRDVRVSTLSGIQILYSLMKNEYIIPGITFLAFGSVSDPFHPKLVGKTLELMESLSICKCPMQFSTKFYINDSIAKRLRSFDKDMSALVTIVTLKKHKVLEPRALEPEKRIESLKILKKYIKPAIFLRPIIPGITDDEIEDIVSLASSLKISIVFGPFRATKRNIERLGRYFDVNEITKRISKKPKGKNQVTLRMDDIIAKAIRIAEEYNVRYFLRASCHNAWAHKRLNVALEYLRRGCVKCENDCPSKIPEIDEKDVEEFLKYLGYKNIKVKVERYRILLNKRVKSWVLYWIKTISGRMVLPNF